MQGQTRAILGGLFCGTMYYEMTCNVEIIIDRYNATSGVSCCTTNSHLYSFFA